MQTADLSSGSGLSCATNGMASKNLQSSLAIKLYTDTAPSFVFRWFLNNHWFADVGQEELSSLQANDSSTALMEM